LTLFYGCDILMEDMKKIFKDKFIGQIKPKAIQQFIINGSAKSRVVFFKLNLGGSFEKNI
jgi:hypothetical protein